MLRHIGTAASAAFTVALLATPLAHAAPTPSHVVVVMLENHDISQYLGNPSAPFINNTLIPNGLLYTDSHGIEHPSQPNYLDFFSGSNQGVNNNNATATNAYNFPAIYAALQQQIGTYQTQLTAGAPGYTAAGLAGLQAKAAQVQPYVAYGTIATGDAFPTPANFNIAAGVPFTTPNLGAALAAAGKTFTEYAEGLIAAGGADANGNANPAVLNNSADPLQVGYAHRHDPASDWISASPVGNELPVTAVQDFSHFASAQFAALPNVSLIVPNTIDDGHDGTAAAGVANSDSWLAANLSGYLTWAKANNSLLIVTTDENDFSAGNHILTVIDGAPNLLQPGSSNQTITHFDVLRTLEDMFGAACTAAACSAAGLASVNGQLAVPEPASVLLLIGALGMLGAVRIRRA